MTAWGSPGHHAPFPAWFCLDERGVLTRRSGGTPAPKVVTQEMFEKYLTGGTFKYHLRWDTAHLLQFSLPSGGGGGRKKTGRRSGGRQERRAQGQAGEM